MYWWSWLADGVEICSRNLDGSSRDKLYTTSPGHAPMDRYDRGGLTVGPLRVDRSSACFIGLARIQVIYGPHSTVLRAHPTRGRGRIDIYDLPFTAPPPSHPPAARPPSQASLKKVLRPARTTGRLGKVSQGESWQVGVGPLPSKTRRKSTTGGTHSDRYMVAITLVGVCNFLGSWQG